MQLRVRVCVCWNSLPTAAAHHARGNGAPRALLVARLGTKQLKRASLSWQNHFASNLFHLSELTAAINIDMYLHCCITTTLICRDNTPRCP